MPARIVMKVARHAAKGRHQQAARTQLQNTTALPPPLPSSRYQPSNPEGLSLSHVVPPHYYEVGEVVGQDKKAGSAAMHTGSQGRACIHIHRHAYTGMGRTHVRQAGVTGRLSA